MAGYALVHLTAAIVAAFVLGVLVGRLTARVTFRLRRDDPADFVTHERLVQIRRM